MRNYNADRSMVIRKTVRVPEYQADVRVPLMQALISGAAVMVVVWLVGWSVSVRFDWKAADVLRLGISLGGVVVAWRWFVEIREIRAERWEETHYGDPVETPDVSETLRVEIPRRPDGRQGGMTLDDLPVTRRQLEGIAQSVRVGTVKWSRRGIARAGGMGRDRADALLDALVTHGFLTYPGGRNHPSGAAPTRKGMALFSALAGVASGLALDESKSGFVGPGCKDGGGVVGGWAGQAQTDSEVRWK